MEKEGLYEWISWLERKEDVKGEVLSERRTQRSELTLYLGTGKGFREDKRRA